MTKLSTRDSSGIQRAIANNESFNTNGSLRGEYQPTSIQYGQLSDAMSSLLRDFMEMNVIDYVVYSYSTPIAFRENGRWIVPDTRYSVTTSKHQGTIRGAVL